MSAFVADPAFVARHPAPRPLVWKAVAGKDVTFPAKDGTPGKGFFVPGKRAAVVMVHEWWGLNDYIKREAERLHAKTGYAVLAVDLYDGKVATTAKEAGELMNGVAPPRATAVAAGGVAALTTGAFGTRYAKLGHHRLVLRRRLVAEHGGHRRVAREGGGGLLRDAARRRDPIKAPVLFVWAKQDGWINAKMVNGFKARMKAAKKPLTVLTYDADHAFANPSNPKYKKGDADDAMAKSVAFLKRNLG